MKYKNLNSELERDLFSFYYDVLVLNKNGSIFYNLQYSHSFDIYEIYRKLKDKYPKKLFKIKVVL